MVWLDQLRIRLRENQSQEHEQAFIRLVIGVLGSLYLLLLPSGADPSGQLLYSYHRYSILFFLSLSVLMLVSIFIFPKPVPLRKILGIFLDLSTASFVMATSGEQGLPMGVVYLWVIMGNGFRYGLPYLLLSTCISFVGLLLVFFWSPFWTSHPILFWSQLLSIVVLPLYMAVLLDKQNRLIDLANEANLAKSRFLANMSHELRTPLNGIIGIGEILLSASPTTKQRGLLQTMQMSAQNLIEMIEKILDFSKTEAGRMTAEMSHFNLDHLVYQTISAIEPLAINKTLPLKIFWDARLPVFLYGDPSHLRQILMNLLGNAVKFTHKGEVSLSVVLAFSDTSGSRIRFEVLDTGIGISELVKPRIFKSFVQGDESVTKRYGGTGLGLSFARQLVELLKGDIGFSSKEGAGSTFWFEIPFGNGTVFPDPETAGISSPKILFWGPKEDFGAYADLLRSFADDIHLIPSRNLVLPTQEEVGIRGVLVAKIGSSNRERFFDLFSHPDNTSVLGAMLKILIVDDDCLLADWKHFPVGGSYVMTKCVPDLLKRAFSLCRWQEGLFSIQPPEPVVGTIIVEARSLRILVAEDNVVNQRVIEEILEGAGHRVRMVSDGEMALDCLESERFDLMILDLCMPLVGGIDVLKTHRFMERESPVPAIILSAIATKEAADSSREARAQAFLTKPIQIALLMSEIERITSVRKEESLPSGGSSEGDSLLDMTILCDLEGVSRDPEFSKKLLAGFISDGERLIAQMEESLIQCNFPDFMDAAHALKGSGIQIGAKKLVSLLVEAESLDLSLVLSGRALFAVDRIKNVFSGTVAEIKVFIEGEVKTVQDYEKKRVSLIKS